jgi:hypothetical protein
MKKMVRLTECDLHRIIKESVNKVLNENGNELQSMVFDAIKSLDEAMMDCENGNCKAAMFNLPHVKQVLKYLSRIL